MNKSDLINKIAKDAGITKVAARKILEAILENIEKTLQQGGRVSLFGFGTWSVVKKAEREGRNPLTGKIIKINAKTVVKFKASSSLLDTDDTGPMKTN